MVDEAFRCDLLHHLGENMDIFTGKGLKESISGLRFSDGCQFRFKYRPLFSVKISMIFTDSRASATNAKLRGNDFFCDIRSVTELLPHLFSRETFGFISFRCSIQNESEPNIQLVFNLLAVPLKFQWVLAPQFLLLFRICVNFSTGLSDIEA